MTGIVDWAAARARMVIAFIVVSVIAGSLAYVGLPKEGEPDIQIPALFVSVQFPGISAEDSEKLLVKPMETELSGLDGLDKMTGTAAENYAGVALEFDFGWDKAKTKAEVRDAMNAAEAEFPEGAEKYIITEVNFSEFPIIIVNLSGDVPERTMTRLARDLRDRLEALEPILEAGIAGNRDEMVEIVIDPLRLESYNLTAAELVRVVTQNNQLIAAGQVDTPSGAFSVKIPSSFDGARDIYELPVKTNGDRVVTLGDLARINLTFEDRLGTARFNGERTVALQVVKRRGFNIIETADLVRRSVAEAERTWPDKLRAVVRVGTSNDQSRTVESMVKQLEGSVLTAIALVMIVSLAALGIRPALLVGFAIPTSFLLCFALLAVMGVAVSNIVMFGLILAVGMLVDGAIVVVEYADKRIARGEGPMHAYVAAAKRMFWPVVSSTATTLCAFLPMLFWPGVPGQFMGMLPITLIFVLSASLLVALVYLPVMGGVTGRLERWFDTRIDRIAGAFWLWHLMAFPLALGALAAAGAGLPVLLQGVTGRFAQMDGGNILGSVVPTLTTVFALLLGVVIAGGVAVAAAITALLALMAAARRVRHGVRSLRERVLPPRPARVRAGYRRSAFGHAIHMVAGNPVAPILTFGAVFIVVGTIFMYYAGHNNGTQFFVESEPETAVVYVRARGNLSIDQKAEIVNRAEEVVLSHPNVRSAFAFAGESGLNNNTGGAQPPRDTIGQVQFEMVKWEDRPRVTETWFSIPFLDIPIKRQVMDPAFDGDRTVDELTARLRDIPGVRFEVLPLERGPASAKPVHLRLKGNDWPTLVSFTETVRERFDQTRGLKLIEDTLPLPGIDWRIDVDTTSAGRYGADASLVGAMVQLVTRGILLDTMRLPSSDDEVDIRVRLPEQDRVLSTLDSLKVRTDHGLVPLSNFITRTPVEKLAQIDRINQTRFFDIKAGVVEGLARTVTNADGTTGEVPITANERIERLTEWLDSGVVPPGIEHEWTGDQEDQQESAQFLQKAFAGALALMFIILLAQFNSFYNAALVLVAVVLSSAGVLVGMLVMDQPFSIIMTGTGIVALAGIVVNNNIVLIDTYQEYSRYMPRIEAITRTAQARIRPVLLTTITTMAGLAPMMFGLNLDFINGGYSFNSPTSLWWKQLATAVVFGLGIATMLTLVFTPAMLALQAWAVTYLHWAARLMARLSLGRGSRAARDWALTIEARRLRAPEIVWPDERRAATDPFEDEDSPPPSLDDLERMLKRRPGGHPLRAAE